MIDVTVCYHKNQVQVGPVIVVLLVELQQPGEGLLHMMKMGEGAVSLKGKERLRKRNKSEGDICAHCRVNGEDHKISGNFKTINWKGCEWCDGWFVTSCINIDPTVNFWKCRGCHQNQNKLDRTSEVCHDPNEGWESLNSKVDSIESNTGTSKLTKLMEALLNR